MRTIQRIILFVLTVAWSLPAQRCFRRRDRQRYGYGHQPIDERCAQRRNRQSGALHGRVPRTSFLRAAANAAGFKEFTARDIPLEIDQVARVDIVMQLGLPNSTPGAAAFGQINGAGSGEKVPEANDGRSSRGAIGFQIHGRNPHHDIVKFKDVLIDEDE